MPTVRRGGFVGRVGEELETGPCGILRSPRYGAVGSMSNEVDDVDNFARLGVDEGLEPRFIVLNLDNVG